MDGIVPVPLVLEVECTATQDEVEGNLKATVARGYAPFMREVGCYSGSLSLCGSGPSLAKTQELTGDILAVNGAIGYLLERGIVPRHAMLWDAAEVVSEFVVPHPGVNYFVASRCHPKVFERLKDCRVSVWHAGGDHDIEKFLTAHHIDDEPMVQGGTTGITRGIYLAFALGYKDLHLFGADSCYVEGASHVNGASKVPETMMDIMIGGRWFKSTPQWAAQIEEMKIIYPALSQPQIGTKITAHDDGMLGWVVSIMNKDLPKALANARAMCQAQAPKLSNPQPLEETA